jgi:hypothetical protein
MDLKSKYKTTIRLNINTNTIYCNLKMIKYLGINLI